MHFKTYLYKIRSVDIHNTFFLNLHVESFLVYFNACEEKVHTPLFQFSAEKKSLRSFDIFLFRKITASSKSPEADCDRTTSLNFFI